MANLSIASGAAQKTIAAALTTAISANGPDWNSSQDITCSTASLTITLPTPTASDLGKAISLRNAGFNAYTVALLGGTFNTAVGVVMNPGSVWDFEAQTVTTATIKSTNAVQTVAAQYLAGYGGGASLVAGDHIKFANVTQQLGGEITLDTATTYTTTANVASLGRITIQPTGTFELEGIPGDLAFSTGGSGQWAGFGWWNADTSTEVEPNGGGSFLSAGSNFGGSFQYNEGDATIKCTVTPTVPTRYEFRVKNATVAFTAAGLSSQQFAFNITKISGAVPVTGQSVAIGQVILNNQIFSTPTFVASTNGSYVFPVAGTYSLRYDIATDGTGSNTNSHIAIFDGAGNLVPGTERVRGGSVTTSQMLSAEIQVTIASPTTYTLRARNGGGGTVTILNGATTQSQITWQQLGSSATTGFVGATQALAGAGGTVPIPSAGQQNFSLLGNGTWGTGALNLTAGTLSGTIGGVTFTITNGDPMTLTTSIAMTGVVTAEVFQVAVGATYDAWRVGGSGLASAGATLIRGGSWNGATSRGIGLSNASFCSVVHGYLIGNGRTFRISGGSTNGAPNVIIEVVN